ncbi:MAG: B12-binding domain-containing radical SAM protein [Candidatus Scalinduaceae bacterium]
MELIIFNPPRYRRGDYHKFNNALLWIASYLYQRNVEVRIVPLNNEMFEETVQREIAKYRPKFAAVSCKWWETLYSSSYIASMIKRCDPGIVTIAGGQTATFFARELVENTNFDVVIRGDGEEPLYRLVTGQKPLNCVFRNDRKLISVRKRYVQSENSLKDVFLIENLEDIVSDINVLNSYIWTGKGCIETCVYCAGNSWNNKQGFGRKKFIYRPIELILREIEILSKYPRSSRLTFDFDPLRENVQENYYLDIFSALEKKKYNCYFYSWSLPNKKLIDSLAETFNFIELCIDVQTPSDRLRKLLGHRRFLKAYFSDEALEDVLNHCQRYDNFMIDMSTLMGLPFEEDEDIKAIKTFSDYFYDKFRNVRYPYVSPMNLEPGSLLMRNPKRYKMVLFRRNFRDFMQYTQRNFENNVNCYQPESYGDGVFHPLGVVPREDYERGDIFRVYETWKRAQENVDKRSEEKTLIRARKYKKYGLLKAGILGGIDRPTLVRSEVE